MPNDFAAKTSGYKNRMSRWEFGRDDNVRMARVGQQLVESVGWFFINGMAPAPIDGGVRQIVWHIRTLGIERQQANAVAERRSYYPSIGRET